MRMNPNRGTRLLCSVFTRRPPIHASNPLSKISQTIRQNDHRRPQIHLQSQFSKKLRPVIRSGNSRRSVGLRSSFSSLRLPCARCATTGVTGVGIGRSFPCPPCRSRRGGIPATGLRHCATSSVAVVQRSNQGWRHRAKIATTSLSSLSVASLPTPCAEVAQSFRVAAIQPKVCDWHLPSAVDRSRT